jgi:hypothetical protein
MLPARRLSGRPSPSALGMPSREQAAAINVRAAMRVASAEFELNDLARTIDGYSATFRWAQSAMSNQASTTRSPRISPRRRPSMG